MFKISNLYSMRPLRPILLTKLDVVQIHKDFFEVQDIIGAGAFGQVYSVIDIKTSRNYSMKIEYIDYRPPQLRIEEKILTRLSDYSNVSRFITAGFSDTHRFLIMELLGPNLEELFVYCGRQFSLQTSLMLIDQIFEIVDALHDHLLIIRDVKLSNFLMGCGNKSHLLYICDFGLSKEYKELPSLLHIPLQMNRPVKGTLRYISLNVHEMVEASRRDDFISALYVGVQMMKGSLPWQHIKGRTHNEKQFRTFTSKRKNGPEIICQGLPAEILQLMRYAYDLKFEEKPDIKYSQDVIRNCMIRYKIEYDYKYDWLNPISN